MNMNNLHELINRYEEQLDYFYVDHEELFKWKAVKRFRHVWTSSEYENISFAEKFNAAKSEFFVLTDNKMVSPSNGVVKIAEKKDAEVRHLFEEVLFADDGGNLTLRQNHIDEFMEGMERLRQETFPNSWKFKQDDRHAAFCYLVAFNPNDNYIYKHDPVEKFAQYVEFGFDIGSGSNFNLKYFYDLCNAIVEAVKEHESLLDKNAKYLKENELEDDNLHILAFDIMYCCNNYGLYNGLNHIKKSEAIKGYKIEKEKYRKEMERQLKLTELDERISQLELQLEPYSSISLLNVKVSSDKYGDGIIIDQKGSSVTVLFEELKKNFVIDKKYLKRPTFEDENDILEAFTEYNRIVENIKQLENQKLCI